MIKFNCLRKATQDDETRRNWNFFWTQENCPYELSLGGRTETQALGIAGEFGWVKPCWYRPSTWENGVFKSDALSVKSQSST